jgi:hypothetical protein
MAVSFVNLVPRVWLVGESSSTILIEIQTQIQTFVSKLKQTPKITYFNELLPCPLEGVCLRSCQLDGHLRSSK